MYITLSVIFWDVKTAKRFDGNIVTLLNIGHGALGIGHLTVDYFLGS
jgi:hypothetical protein